MIPRNFRLMVLISAVSGVFPPAFADTKIEKKELQVAKGVTYVQEIRTGDAPRIVNLLKIDPKAPGVRFEQGQANDLIGANGDLARNPTKREQIGTLAVRKRAVAAINADFFAWTADPLGFAVQNGELISEPMDYRACIAFLEGSKDEKTETRIEFGVMASEGTAKIGDRTLTLHGVNRLPQEGEIIVETPRFVGANVPHKAGFVVQMSTNDLPLRVSQELTAKVETVSPLEQNGALPVCPRDKVLLIAFGDAGTGLAEQLKLGDAVKLRFDLVPNLPTPAQGKYPSRAARTAQGVQQKPMWQNVAQAISGGPWLVKAGEIAIDGEAEGFNPADFILKRHPRTAFGVTGDGKVLLLTVDGRETWSIGASLQELAELMQKFGAVNAINLDGGGSTSMFVGGGIVNAPSDGRLRTVADGLLVFADTLDTPELNNPRIEPTPVADAVSISLHAKQRFRLVGEDGSPLPSGIAVIWGTEDGLGFITQAGEFQSHHTGYGTVTARVGNRTLRVSLRVK